MKHVIRTCYAVAFLGAALWASGCTKPADSAKKTDKGGEKAKGHDHPHEGPHEGALAEWGEEQYHAEFTVDHDKQEATVYILDGSAKKAVPIEAKSITLTITNVKPPAKITLEASADKGDPAGMSSRFVGKHEQLKTKMEFKGEISGEVKGKPYTGTFEEKGHDHDHKKK